MKKSLISILCGIIILVIGIGLFLTTYLQGATGFHSDFFNIGFDGYDHFGLLYTDRNHKTSTSAVEADIAQEYVSSSTSSKNGAPTTEWNLADMDDFSDISLNVDCADVKITTTSNSSGKVTFKKLSEASCFVSYGTLYIDAYSTNTWEESVNGQKIEIVLPKDTKLNNLYADLNIGDFSCSGMEIFNADISTDLGEITLKNMQADVLNVTSHCGEIDLEDIKCSDLTGGADLGDLEIKGSIGTATLTISMGNCEFEGSIGDFTINNDMGNIEMEITKAPSNYYIDITNSMGEIQIDNQKTNNNSYQYGNTDAPYLGFIYSSMGNVEIEFDRD